MFNFATWSRRYRRPEIVFGFLIDVLLLSLSGGALGSLSWFIYYWRGPGLASVVVATVVSYLWLKFAYQLGQLHERDIKQLDADLAQMSSDLEVT